MKEKYSLLSLILIMSFSVLLVGGFTFNHLYQVSIEEQRAWLSNTAQSQARLIESVARFDEKYSSNYPEGTTAATLSQIIDAHSNYKGFGETGEFTLARREGDKIVFLLRHRHFALEKPKPVLFGSKLAEPMERALLGRSGTMIGIDYRGVEVLAAHEPVAELNLGIVAKMDIKEIREPFVRAGVKSGIVAILFIAVGSLLFIYITNPIIENLKNSQRQMKLTLEGTGQGLWAWDVPEDRITFDENWPKMLGYKPGEIQFDFNWWNKSIDPESIPVSEKAFNSYIEGHKKYYEYEYRIKSKAGGWKWIWTRGICVEYNKEGKPVEMIGTNRDITDLKQAGKELEDMKSELLMQSLFSQRLSALGALSGGIAHEINQPLSGIGLYATTLLNILKDKNKIDSNYFSDTLARIVGQVSRSKKIIKHMREFSSGEKIEIVENLSLKYSVEKSLELFYAQLNAHDIELNIDIPSNLDVPVNMSRFEQVIVNLVSNARDSLDEKFSKSMTENIHKHIILRGSKEKDVIFLDIIDNGIGVSKDLQGNLFEPFVTNKKKGKGSGLGLSICKKILKDFGAEIELKKTNSDGSTFRIRFSSATEKNKGFKDSRGQGVE